MVRNQLAPQLPPSCCDKRPADLHMPLIDSHIQTKSPEGVRVRQREERQTKKIHPKPHWRELCSTGTADRTLAMQKHRARDYRMSHHTPTLRGLKTYRGKALLSNVMDCACTWRKVSEQSLARRLPIPTLSRGLHFKLGDYFKILNFINPKMTRR